MAMTAAVAMSAGGLDLQSRIILQRRSFEKARKELNRAKSPLSVNVPFVADASVSSATSSESTLAFVKIEDGFSSSDLEKAGMNVLAVKGRVAIVGLPFDRVEELASSPAVRKLSLQRPVKPMMDISRKASGVDIIHQGGDGLEVPYTGKGVIAGIVDQGMDPNHVAFLDENGKSRVTYLTYFDGTADKDGVPNFSLYGDEIYDIINGHIYWYPTLDKFTTDEKNSYHGTHTMNILGGGYKGDVKVAKGLSGSTPVLESIPNPYYGVAPDVQFAASCGELQDACIAYGINGILDYAAYAKENHGMPSVLSLSLGSTAGPHDPNGLMNQFLDECGDETIVVLAAGNEGDLKIALNKDMKSGDNQLQTMIYPYGYRYDKTAGDAGTKNTYFRNGSVVIYSNDKTPFKIEALVLAGSEGNYRERATFDVSAQEGRYLISDNYYANYVGGTVNSTIARYFDGYIGGGSMYDEDLGRYYGVFDYYLYTNPETGFNEDGSEGVVVGFRVIGADGQRIDCYCDGMNTWMSNYGMDTFMDGSCDGTISDMAVGHNVLVVGAYTMRNRWTSLDGKDYGYYESDGFVINDIGHYSSYGTLADGRKLPHVCAPGSAVISAMSTPYVDNFFKGYEQYIPFNFQAKAEVGGRTYYWKQETGTSMSTPFVAGSIALWLEADPTLGIDDVRDIIAQTAVRDEFVEKGNQVQWGAGKFDALAGLKEVVKRAGVGSVTAESNNDRLILTPVGQNMFNVFVGDAASLDIKVFGLTGVTVFSGTFSGCEATVDLSSLTPGVYAANVNGHSKKLVIR